MVGETVFICLRLFLVFRHVLAVESFDVVHVDGDASLVSVTSPLGVLWLCQFFVPNVHCAEVMVCYH